MRHEARLEITMSLGELAVPYNSLYYYTYIHITGKKYEKSTARAASKVLDVSSRDKKKCSVE